MISPETNIFMLLVLALIRFIGGIIFLDFFLNHRNRRFILITIAFVLFSLTPLLQVFLPSIDELKEISLSDLSPNIFLFAETLTLIAVCLFAVVAFNYVMKINERLVIGLLFIIVAIPSTFSFFLSFELMFYLIQAIIFTLILSMVPLVIKKWEVFKRIANNAPIFMAITLVIALSNTLLTFLENDIAILLELLTRISLSFVLPFVFVNLEYNIVAIQKFQLKDKYSHDLGQLLQMVSGFAYLIESGQDISNNSEKMNQIMKEVNELLELIREL
ncbi:hypothetical protein CEE45_08245 [Candidatus Heimdallarchaeota archaeon B3_Heim]|nr:MAG: hypothetical protein CEE45_08245 [Candidatus Heimdallarchaeota archaeon B3_Heim]